MIIIIFTAIWVICVTADNTTQCQLHETKHNLYEYDYLQTEDEMTNHSLPCKESVTKNL